MVTLSRVTFLLLAAALNQKVAAQWPSPYFEAPPAGPGNVEFTQQTNLLLVSSTFDEQIKDPSKVILTTLTYKESTQPTVTFSEGLNENLGLTLRQEPTLENKWVVEISLEQDFESQFKSYRVEISVPGTRGILEIKVRNLNDNAPYFDLSNIGCQNIKEDFTGETDCSFTLRDPDGILAADAAISVEPANLFQLTTPTQNEAGSVQVKLLVLADLDFETSQLHMLTLTASDGDLAAESQMLILRIDDVADTPPVWINPPPPILVIIEEEETIRPFSARDGDSGSSASLLEFELAEGDPNIFSVSTTDGSNGLLSIKSIDRDAGFTEFSIKIRAKEVNDATSIIEQQVQIIVNDANDNTPTITPAQLEASVDEGHIGNINFGEIKVTDPDLGASGQYRIELEDVSEFDWKSAFRVIPDSGYQSTIFTISVIDSEKLDFEDENWRSISLTLKVTEIADDTHTQSVPVTITVSDLNDESPIFTEPEYAADVQEIVAVDTEILTVTANDGDENDSVTYAILTVNSAVKIDPATGKISTNRENPFDFETQTQIIIQVAATDLENHRSIVTVTLNVIDSNDTPPTLSLPNVQLSVEENEQPGVLITNEITAVDPDETANLQFAIDWDKTYATNKGVRVTDPNIYTDCVTVKTELNNDDTGDVKAVLETADVPFNWETFDTIYVSLSVTDTDQIANNKREAILTIGVNNVNDNPPVFDVNTLGEKSVREKTNAGQLIGYVVATDPDFLDPITYTLEVVEGSAPLDWVSIDDKGEIKTTEVEIDAEQFSVLNYKVIASDSSSSQEETITIQVIDVNDEIPVFDPPGGPFEIDENSADGTVIATVRATDNDFSDPYSKNLRYELNLDFPALSNYFTVGETSGEVTVQKRAGFELDRDVEPFREYTIELLVRDNTPSTPGVPSDTQVGRTSFQLTLKDLNDEKPEFEDVIGNTEVNENIGIDGVVRAGISAPDKDEAGTPFSEVTYEITQVIPAPPGGDIFKLANKDNKADILAARDLRGLYGDYIVTIRATDGGGEFNEKDFTIVILDLNDNKPSFVWPDSENFQIRVSVNQTEESFLNGEDDRPLRDLEGADLDDINNGNGQIEFFIEGGEDAIRYLKISPTSINKARLVVKEEFPEEGLILFPLTLVARDKGSDPEETRRSGQVFIINKSEVPPIYSPDSDLTIEWEENDATVSADLPLASDVNNENMVQENWQLIYYHIIEGDTERIFTISNNIVENVNVPTIGLTDPNGSGLDSDQGPNLYTLKVIASNAASSPPGILDERSVITVTINVLDMPDSPPVFAEDLYVGGIAPADVTGVEIVRISATDTDQNDPTTYRILQDSMSASESYLQEVMNTAFTLEETTGRLETNFAPQEYMKGYFSFQVEARDSVGNVDTADVQIYIINASNRVKFLFVNDLATVDAERDFIDQVFTSNLGFECAIDSVDNTGEDGETVVSVRTHFVDSEINLPVEGSVIETKASNIETLTSMRSQLLDRQLNLYDVTSNRQPEEDNLAAILTTTLIVVSIVLGALVVILLVAFVVKTRGLNKRLEALSTTRFGSQESGLNRIAMNVPNTNRHALEGSNPVWNEEVPNYDNNSQGSGDSDLIGIEDMPEFGYKDNQGFQSSYGDFYGGNPDISASVGNDNPDIPATYL